MVGGFIDRLDSIGVKTRVNRVEVIREFGSEESALTSDNVIIEFCLVVTMELRAELGGCFLFVDGLP